MVKIKTFRAIRPKERYAPEVAALPYDVYSTEEAREEIGRHPLSFLQVDLPAATVEGEISDGINSVARKNFEKMKADGIFYREKEPSFYVYEIDDGKHRQRGLMCAVSVDDYEKDVVKKHEKTRREKEEDRVNHIDTLDAQTGPIFLTYRDRAEIRDLIDAGIAEEEMLEFTTDDGITHRVWTIRDGEIIEKLTDAFEALDFLYIADGHHRSASAVRVGKMRREAFGRGDDETPYNYFMSVVYPSNALNVYDYNRVVSDTAGLSAEEIVERIEKYFSVKREDAPVRPGKKGEFGMFLDETWYRLSYRGEPIDDVIEGLDVSILQNFILDPIFGIEDPRSDERIDFVGGVRGLEELERRVRTDMAIAFSMYPTSLDDLMEVADQNKVMPPKSTWFEPKPRSGLFIHPIGKDDR